MDAIRAGKDAGDSSLKATKTYFGIRNSARDAGTTHPAIDHIVAAAGDDGTILLKIVEAIAAATRLMAKANPMEMADSIFDHGV